MYVNFGGYRWSSDKSAIEGNQIQMFFNQLHHWANSYWSSFEEFVLYDHLKELSDYLELERVWKMVSITFRVLRKPILWEAENIDVVLIKIFYWHNFSRHYPPSCNLHTLHRAFEQETLNEFRNTHI